MFYVENKIIPYPYKSIIEDVLSRSDWTLGSSTANKSTQYCFTPYPGMNHLIKTQHLDIGDKFSIEEYVAGYSDFSASKLRSVGGGAAESDEDEELGNSIRLEDIDSSFIEKYLNNVLTGFKINSNGRKSLEIDTIDEFMYGSDDDEEKLVSPVDLLEVERRASFEEISEAKQKLPYLLKILWDGSVEKRGSLLSFIIANLKALNKVEDLKPSNYICEGVWRVENGRITRPFEDGANTQPTFRHLIEWTQGKQPDRYYDAWKQLQDCCEILGIDLTEEDPLDYGEEFAKKAVCTYVQSNKEYIEGYGNIDKQIYQKLSEKTSLFDIAREMEVSEDFDISYNTETNSQLKQAMHVETIAIAVGVEVEKGRLPVGKTEAENRSRLKAVLQIILDGGAEWSESKFNSILKGLVIDNGVLCIRSTGNYLFYNLPVFHWERVGKLALITQSGTVVAVSNTLLDEMPRLVYCDYKEFVNAYREGNRPVNWEILRI